MEKRCPNCVRQYPLVAFRDGICIECWELGRRRSREVARRALNKALAGVETKDPVSGLDISPELRTCEQTDK